MRVIAKSTLRSFRERHPPSEQSLKSWYAECIKVKWKTPGEIQEAYPRASILPNNRVVFRIKGNTYRLVVAINYSKYAIWIKFIGTHQEYDKIDANKVNEN